MKNLILLLIPGAYWSAAGDNTGKLTDFSSWTVNSPWTITPAKQAVLKYDGSKEYRKLTTKFNLDANKYYQLTIEYRNDGTDKNTGLFGKIGATLFKLPYINDWGKFTNLIFNSAIWICIILFKRSGS